MDLTAAISRAISHHCFVICGFKQMKHSWLTKASSLFCWEQYEAAQGSCHKPEAGPRQNIPPDAGRRQAHGQLGQDCG